MLSFYVKWKVKKWAVTDSISQSSIRNTWNLQICRWQTDIWLTGDRRDLRESQLKIITLEIYRPFLCREASVFIQPAESRESLSEGSNNNNNLGLLFLHQNTSFILESKVFQFVRSICKIATKLSPMTWVVDSSNDF